MLHAPVIYKKMLHVFFRLASSQCGSGVDWLVGRAFGPSRNHFSSPHNDHPMGDFSKGPSSMKIRKLCLLNRSQSAGDFSFRHLCWGGGICVFDVNASSLCELCWLYSVCSWMFVWKLLLMWFSGFIYLCAFLAGLQWWALIPRAVTDYQL